MEHPTVTNSSKFYRCQNNAVRACDPTEDKKRIVTFCFSDATPDRYGDVINPQGWHLENYNGIALFGHNSYDVEMVIGKAFDVKVMENELRGSIELHPEGMCEVSDLVWGKLCFGSLNSVSVGFRPLKYQRAKDSSRPDGIDFLEQELLEISVVPIPANPNATQRGLILKSFSAESLGSLSGDLPPVQDVLSPEQIVAERRARVKSLKVELAKLRRG